MNEPSSSPFNAIPPAVVALAVVIIGLEAMFQLAVAGMLGGPGGIGWRVDAINDFAVVDSVFEWMRATSTYPQQQVVRFVTYPLLHGNFIHAAFVVVFILALGKLVAESFSQAAFVVIFWGSSIVAGLAFVMVLDSRAALFGGYPGAYGLIGAFSYIRMISFQRLGESQTRAFSMIAVLLGVQLIFAVFQGEYATVLSNLVGFATGFLLSFVLRPGGWAALLTRLRKR